MDGCLCSWYVCPKKTAAMLLMFKKKMKNCADIILEETYLPASSCMESSKKAQIEN